MFSPSLDFFATITLANVYVEEDIQVFRLSTEQGRVDVGIQIFVHDKDILACIGSNARHVFRRHLSKVLVNKNLPRY